LVGYKFYQPKDSPEPLTLKLLFIQAEVSRFWGIKPWEFKSLEKEKKAELHAAYKVKQEIDAYYASERMRKMDRDKK
jgi:hypothetical protein